MRWLSAVILISILQLAGCGNSGNTNAPTSKAPHEKTWVTYHRNDIVSANGATNLTANPAQPVVDGTMIKEHVNQCQACHGATLMGARSGAAGPACLDCHVLDPVRYPVLCYSCHGGKPYPVMNPQQWYSTNRAERNGLPLDPVFISRVRNDNIHLKHDALKAVTPDKCGECHGGPNIIGEPHHNIVMQALNLGCLGPLPFGCHTFDPTTFTLVLPDCSICHNSLP